MFDAMRFDVKSAFPKAREYVEKFILAAELDLPLGHNLGFEVEEAFEDSLESLRFDLVDVAGKQKPPLQHANGEWDHVDDLIEKLIELAASRAEEIIMGVEEQMHDARVNV